MTKCINVNVHFLTDLQSGESKISIDKGSCGSFSVQTDDVEEKQEQS